MSGVEEMLLHKKREINLLEVPVELEGRLSASLKDRSNSRGHKPMIKAAVIVLALTLLSFNFNALAYYARQLLGYESVMNGTLRELNELGKGQEIGMSYAFENGTIFTLDGIMVDSNQLLAFYTLKAPTAETLTSRGMPQLTLEGSLREYYMQGGQGEIDEEANELRAVATFDPPGPFARNLKLIISHFEEGNTEQGQINFKLNRKKAMGHTFKCNLNQTIEVDNTKVHVKSLIASPTTTIIKGSIGNLLEFVENELNGEKMRVTAFDIQLVANGELVEHLGAGMSTNYKGITFEEQFDALPSDLESLQIRLVRLGTIHRVEKELSLCTTGKEQILEIDGQHVVIKGITPNNGYTHITISSQDNVLLSGVTLAVDGDKVSLENTVDSDYSKTKDGIFHQRTLRFKGTGKELTLHVNSVVYAKDYDRTIDVPIE